MFSGWYASSMVSTMSLTLTVPYSKGDAILGPRTGGRTGMGAAAVHDS